MEKFQKAKKIAEKRNSEERELLMNKSKILNETNKCFEYNNKMFSEIRKCFYDKSYGEFEYVNPRTQVFLKPKNAQGIGLVTEYLIKDIEFHLKILHYFYNCLKNRKWKQDQIACLQIILKMDELIFVAMNFCELNESEFAIEKDSI